MREDDKTLSVRISKKAHARLRKLATSKGVRVSDIARNLLYGKVDMEYPLPSPAEDDGWEPAKK